MASNFDRLASGKSQAGPASNPAALAALLSRAGVQGKAAAQFPKGKSKSKQNVRSHGQPTIQLPKK